jgi:Skp family chaperone for outer membrane proteins
VKKSPRWAILAAVVLSLNCVTCLAQAQVPMGAPSGQSPAAVRLALLDVGRIFKNHARFKGMMEAMKADVERAEKQVKAERDEINKLGENMQEFRKGTIEYKQKEEELAKRQADLQVKVQLQKNEFLQREAKIYHNVYQEILQVTDYFAKQNRIDMVLRFNGEEVDVERPDSVLSFINKPVVWYDPGLDITNDILRNVNRGAVNPGPANNAMPMRQGVPFSR